MIYHVEEGLGQFFRSGYSRGSAPVNSASVKIPDRFVARPVFATKSDINNFKDACSSGGGYSRTSPLSSGERLTQCCTGGGCGPVAVFDSAGKFIRMR